jgi:hypothetical protein
MQQLLSSRSLLDAKGHEHLRGNYAELEALTCTVAVRSAMPAGGKADRRRRLERPMSLPFLTTSAVVLLIAGPAWADCGQELEGLKQAVTQAETGASSTESGLPATQHQEEVLAGDQQGEEATAGAGAAGQGDVPASPHQEQAVAEPAAGPPGGGDADAGQQAAELVAQADEMAKAGNEEGCMQKVAEAKDLLGID